MATAIDMITRATTKIGIRAAETSLQADEIQDGVSELNDMLSEWEESGLLLGFSPVNGPADPVRVPRGAESAVVNNLAVRLAPEYSRPVPAALALSADRSFKNMLRGIVRIGDVDHPATLPLGSGNSCDAEDSRFFAQKDTVNF